MTEAVPTILQIPLRLPSCPPEHYQSGNTWYVALPRSLGGFTLIELLVTLAIAGLIAVLGFPSYKDSLHRTRRADAMVAALSIQLAQEHFRATCPFYAQNLGTSRVCGASAAASTLQVATSSAGGWYQFSIAADSATGSTYTIVAQPSGMQKGDSACAPMTLSYSAEHPEGLKMPVECW